MNFINELQGIKNEIKLLEGKDYENEFKKISGENIEKYHKMIMPKLEHFAGSIKQLNDLRDNLEALVEKAVLKSVKSIMGKVD
jgi:hypothetical protein